jgi:hypothetical protein
VTFDPSTVRDLLLNADVDDIGNFPQGFEIESRQQLPLSTWCKPPKGDLAEIGWQLKRADPGELEAIVFTIFPSNGAARAAWQRGKDSLPCVFRARSTTPVEILSISGAELPARLFNGAISPGPVSGFSNGQVLLGNVIARSSAVSTMTMDSANANTAVLLLKGVVSFLSGAYCPNFPPCL